MNGCRGAPDLDPSDLPRLECRAEAEARRWALVTIADRLATQPHHRPALSAGDVRYGILQAEAALAWTDEAGALVQRALAEETA